MTQHIVRLIWNRKRQNLLLLLELLVAFLVVVTLSVMAVQVANNARQPLGFTYDNLWTVNLGRAFGGPDRDQSPADARQTYQTIAAVVHDLPGIQAATLTWTGPFENFNWNSVLPLQDGREIRYGLNKADDRFAEALGLRLVEGRWFTREDDGVAWEPVVVNARLARMAFGNGPAVGSVIPERPDPSPRGPGASSSRPKRVVGVIEDFRQFGEYSTPEPYLFMRLALDDPRTTSQLPELLIVRVPPGTTAAFEETLVRRLQQAAPGWSFTVSPMEAARESMQRQYLLPLGTLGSVAAALLLMTALGLTGVVWQNVTQRTREFGLRRANGATAAGIRQQVLLELVALTTLAVLAGSVLIAQVAFVPLPPEMAVIPAQVFVTGVALAAVAVYLVTLLSGLYPAALATRVPPADALHYE